MDILSFLGWRDSSVGQGPGDRDMNSVTAITFSCAAVHYLAVYNLQCHQRPVPHTYIVWEVKNPCVSQSVDSGLRLSPPHLIHRITAKI